MDRCGEWGAEPGFIIKADGIDYQGVALPAADGVAHERGVKTLGMRAAVGVNEAVLRTRIIFVENRDAFGAVNDLCGADAGAGNA